MSSTARGAKRNESDFYATPSWPVKRLLERVKLPGGIWLETSAGDGAIIKAVNAVRQDIDWFVFELRNECRSQLQPLVSHPAKLCTGMSFLDVPRPAKYTDDVSINNVPFSIAQPMIEHSLAFAPHVLHLLRLNYLGTETRNKFFQGNMPDIYVIPDRVSFAQSLKCKTCKWAMTVPLNWQPPVICPQCTQRSITVSSSDSIEYAWMHWTPERNRRFGKVEVLDCTPLEERTVAKTVPWGSLDGMAA